MKTKPKDLKINGQAIPLGAETRIEIPIAQLPSSTQVGIPVIISRSKKPGPVMLLMAGLHGDELNGVEIVRRILEAGLHRPERGSIVVIPILNVFGFNNFDREVNGKDVNRSFPGSKNGSLASQVAYTLMKTIIPIIDFGLDFHTGGKARTNFPQIRITQDDLNNVTLAEAFNPPFIIHSPFIKGSLRYAAAKVGKRIIVFEGGESMRIDQDVVEEGIRGYKCLIKKMKLSPSLKVKRGSRLYIEKMKWLRAPGSGIFVSEVASGQKIKADDLLGHIKSPLGEYSIEMRSPADGYIVGINNNSLMNQGDPVVHLGIKWSKTKSKS